MFKKIKEVKEKGKQWVIKHKVELAYLAGGIVGIAATTVAYNYNETKISENNKTKFGPEISVLKMRKDAYWIDSISGDSTCTMSELSDKLISNGAEKNAPVIGALVYSEKE